MQRRAHATAPPAAWFAVLIVLAELVASAVGGSPLGLAAAALLAPGLAWCGLLPPRIRASVPARLAIAPVLGVALTSIALISMARAGIHLTPTSVRVVLGVLVLAGLVFSGRSRAHDARTAGGDSAPSRARAQSAAELAGASRGRLLLEAAVPAAIVLIGLVLGWQVAGRLPVPGDDWAKYLLYADEIRHHGTLLLQNRFWMGGRPFSEDPGMGALEGAALILSGAPAGALVHTILVLGAIQVLAIYGVARAQFGLAGAAATALLIVLVPATQNILGWHGLANAVALGLMALILGQLGTWLAGELDGRAQVGLAVALVGVAAAHRLSAAITVGTVAAVCGLALVAGPARLKLALAAGRTLLWCAPLGLLVLLDLRVRSQEGGGTQPYTAYLGTKVDLALALRDLSPVLVALAVGAFVLLTARRRLPRAAWPAAALMAVCLVLSYAWVLHLPLYYARTVFFMPLALAPIAGAGVAAFATRLGAVADRRLLPTAAVGAAIIAGVMGTTAWHQAGQVREFYSFATPGSLHGLDVLAEELAPDEIVATDRCWSFLATWMLHTRTYPALETQDIQPMAELRVARAADQILRGTARGEADRKRLGIRYAVIDPACPVSRKPYYPPGTPVFAASRIVIVALAPSAHRGGHVSASASAP